MTRESLSQYLILAFLRSQGVTVANNDKEKELSRAKGLTIDNFSPTALNGTLNSIRNRLFRDKDMEKYQRARDIEFAQLWAWSKDITIDDLSGYINNGGGKVEFFLNRKTSSQAKAKAVYMEITGEEFVPRDNKYGFYKKRLIQLGSKCFKGWVADIDDDERFVISWDGRIARKANKDEVYIIDNIGDVTV